MGVQQGFAEQPLVVVAAELDRAVTGPKAGVARQVGRDGKCVTAHGRSFGYCITLLGPSIEPQNSKGKH
jgi:hypothetical protein